MRRARHPQIDRSSQRRARGTAARARAGVWDDPRTACRSIATVAALLLCVVACSRTPVSTRTYALDLGEVVVEQWDDPVDTLISWRVYWRGDGRREPVAEIWRGAPWMSHDDPVRLERDPDGVLRLRIGPFHCFERVAPTTGCATYDIQVEDWRHCSASRRQTC